MYAYRSRVVRYIAWCIDAIGTFLFLLVPKNKSIFQHKVKKILVVKLDHIGDCFLLSPLFSYLQQAFPDATCDVLCQELTRQVFEQHPDIFSIKTFNYFRTWRGFGKKATKKDFFILARELKKERYDLFIDPRGDAWVSFLGFLIRAPYRIGFAQEEIGSFFYTHKIFYNQQEHETKRYSRLLKFFNVSVLQWKPRIYHTAEEEQKVKEYIRAISSPYVVIHITSGAEYKIWPQEKFLDIVRRMLSETSVTVVLAGSISDKEKTSRLQVACGDTQRVRNAAGFFSIRESYLLISQAKAFLGNDSVLGHFAGASDVPTITLMNAGVDAKRWGPLGERSVVITGKDKVHACTYDQCSYPCPHMNSISADQVWDTLRTYLS